jgi:hypothetical protein
VPKDQFASFVEHVARPLIQERSRQWWARRPRVARALLTRSNLSSRYRSLVMRRSARVTSQERECGRALASALEKIEHRPYEMKSTRRQRRDCSGGEQVDLRRHDRQLTWHRGKLCEAGQPGPPENTAHSAVSRLARHLYVRAAEDADMRWTGILTMSSLLAGACVLAAGCGGDDENTGLNGTGATSGADGGGAGGAGGASGGTGGGTAGAGGSTGGTAGTGGGAAGAGGSSGGSSCGDFVCDPGECATCSPDCGPACLTGCGDGTCDSSESCSTCPADCQNGCGDGCCLIGENCQNCAQDCVTVEGCDPSACGNNQCNYGLSETCLNCADCFGLCDCGNGTCAAPETPQNCPWDCN